MGNQCEVLHCDGVQVVGHDFCATHLKWRDDGATLVCRDGFESLRAVFAQAVEQASGGKGLARLPDRERGRLHLLAELHDLLILERLADARVRVDAPPVRAGARGASRGGELSGSSSHPLGPRGSAAEGVSEMRIMKVYVAAKFEEQDAARAAMAEVRRRGHEVTHDWTTESDADLIAAVKRDPSVENVETLVMYRAECARKDTLGVAEADGLVILPHPQGRGSMFEMGVAKALGKPIVAVTPGSANPLVRDGNVFFQDPAIVWVDSAAEAVRELEVIWNHRVAMGAEVDVARAAKRAFNEYAAGGPVLDELSRLQRDVAVWQQRNFGYQSVDRNVMGCVEELGELSHAVLKHLQGIRGVDEDKVRAKVADAGADLTVYLLGVFTSLRLDFGVALRETAARVMRRDWVADKVAGGSVG